MRADAVGAENGHIESFNGKLRDECLNVELFYSMAAARQKLERWRRDYNEVRPRWPTSGVQWKKQSEPRQANFLPTPPV